MQASNCVWNERKSKEKMKQILQRNRNEIFVVIGSLQSYAMRFKSNFIT